MADHESQEISSDNVEKKKSFWNKAEQISRVYHNVVDGSFKLAIIIGIVAILVLGFGLYSKTTSGIDSAKNWGCEYINPFCDTKRESDLKAEKARKKAELQAAEERAALVKAEKSRGDVEQNNTEENEATAQAISGKTNESVEEPGMLTRGWSAVKGWLPDNEKP